MDKETFSPTGHKKPTKDSKSNLNSIKIKIRSYIPLPNKNVFFLIFFQFFQFQELRNNNFQGVLGDNE